MALSNIIIVVFFFWYVFLGTLSGTPNLNVNKEEDSKEDQLSLDAHTVDLKDDDTSTIGKKAQTFKFQELVDATGNFNPRCFLGEGGFGKVYKGHFSDTNQVGYSPDF